MCIIAYKPAGVDHPTKAVLKNCIEYNPDYCGYMVATGTEVLIRKGFGGLRALRKSITRVERDYGIDTKEFPVVYHFRIATSGLVKPQNSHPFPVSSSVKDLQSCFMSAAVGMAHNGIISGVGKEKNISDTQLFVRDFMSNFSFEELKSERIKNLMELGIDGDRVIVLDGSGDIVSWGDWEESEKVWYSNDTYKESAWAGYGARYYTGQARNHYSGKGVTTYKACKGCGKVYADYLLSDGFCASCDATAARDIDIDTAPCEVCGVLTPLNELDENLLCSHCSETIESAEVRG